MAGSLPHNVNKDTFVYLRNQNRGEVPSNDPRFLMFYEVACLAYELLNTNRGRMALRQIVRLSEGREEEDKSEEEAEEVLAVRFLRKIRDNFPWVSSIWEMEKHYPGAIAYVSGNRPHDWADCEQSEGWGVNFSMDTIQRLMRLKRKMDSAKTSEKEWRTEAYRVEFVYVTVYMTHELAHLFSGIINGSARCGTPIAVCAVEQWDPHVDRTRRGEAGTYIEEALYGGRIKRRQRPFTDDEVWNGLGKPSQDKPVLKLSMKWGSEFEIPTENVQRLCEGNLEGMLPLSSYVPDY